MTSKREGSLNDWQLLQRELERRRAESTARYERPSIFSHERYAWRPGEWLLVLCEERIFDEMQDFSKVARVRKGKIVLRPGGKEMLVRWRKRLH